MNVLAVDEFCKARHLYEFEKYVPRRTGNYINVSFSVLEVTKQTAFSRFALNVSLWNKCHDLKCVVNHLKLHIHAKNTPYKKRTELVYSRAKCRLMVQASRRVNDGPLRVSGIKRKIEFRRTIILRGNAVSVLFYPPQISRDCTGIEPLLHCWNIPELSPASATSFSQQQLTTAEPQQFSY
jgi:hypothetical protein